MSFKYDRYIKQLTLPTNSNNTGSSYLKNQSNFIVWGIPKMLRLYGIVVYENIKKITEKGIQNNYYILILSANITYQTW